MRIQIPEMFVVLSVLVLIKLINSFIMNQVFKSNTKTFRRQSTFILSLALLCVAKTTATHAAIHKNRRTDTECRQVDETDAQC